MSVTIGIDFGTSFCSASWINPATGKPEAVRFKDTGSEKMPSIIAFSKSGKAFVGSGPYTQLENLAVDPTLTEEEREMQLCNFYTGIKTHIRQGNKWMRPEKTYTDDDLIALIFKKIKEEVELSCTIDGTIDKVVLTHPVQFGDRKKDMLKHAAALAGFSKVKLLREPESAALYAVKANLVPSNCRGLLVYDFGAGTFDVSYIQIESDGELHMPVQPQGDAHCGGDDIDRALYEDWSKYIKATKGKDIGPNSGELDIAFLYRCRRQKEQLSKGFLQDEIREYIPGMGSIRRPFTEDDFNRIIKPIIDRTIAKVQVVVNEIKKKQLPLTHAVLIGGSSNLPLVKTKMQSALGNNVKIITTGNYDIAVAVGALYSLNVKIEPPKPAEQPKPQPQECFCIHCGKKIMTSHKVCMYCGKPNFSYKP